MAARDRGAVRCDGDREKARLKGLGPIDRGPTMTAPDCGAGQCNGNHEKARL
jgi:hypothetical protein